MSMGHTIRVRVSAPPAEARKLCARLTRGGIAAAVDDGESNAEILVVQQPKDAAPFRARAGQLLVIGSPGGKYFADGADDVVVPGRTRGSSSAGCAPCLDARRSAGPHGALERARRSARGRPRRLRPRRAQPASGPSSGKRRAALPRRIAHLNPARLRVGRGAAVAARAAPGRAHPGGREEPPARRGRGAPHRFWDSWWRRCRSGAGPGAHARVHAHPPRCRLR